MTPAEAHGKITKLLALAAPGSGATAGEAASAKRIANTLGSKYGWPPPSQSSSAGIVRALNGQVSSSWGTPSQREPEQGISWWQWVGRAFGSNRVGISGITDAQARIMAVQILTTGAFLNATDQEVIEGALNGLLTERGKILLDGLYSITC
jgi:hypothetical protein